VKDVSSPRARLIGIWFRIAVIGICWVAASSATYLGAMLYAFSFRPERSAHVVGDRINAAGFVILALLISVFIAWLLGFASRPKGLWITLLFSVGAALLGATAIYGAIWRGLWPLFDK